MKYLKRTLDAETSESFAKHYLECDQCFMELRATEMLIAGLRRGRVGRKMIGDIAVFQFDRPDEGKGEGHDLGELCREVLEQDDTKVLIDLSQVSRMDSVGLGMLMHCYSHIIRNRGMIKLVNLSPQVWRVLSMTRIDSVIEAYVDQNEALRAFHRSPAIPPKLNEDGIASKKQRLP